MILTALLFVVLIVAILALDTGPTPPRRTRSPRPPPAVLAALSVMLAGCSVPPAVAAPLSDAVAAGLKLVALALGARLYLYLHAHAKTDGQRKFLDRVAGFTRTTVAALAQTTVAEWKAKTATGKLTKDDAMAALRLALVRVKGLLTPAGVMQLAQVVGGDQVNAYLEALVESHVLDLKNSAPMVVDGLIPPPKPPPAPTPPKTAAGDAS